jgi:MarR family transcriptional regulator, organic hydroperoxide resistance regulator
MPVDPIRGRDAVSGAQRWGLCQVKEHPGITLTDLAQAMALHQSTTSNLVRKLVLKRLVRRERDSGDARVIHLRLTAVGVRVVADLQGQGRAVLLETLEQLSPQALSRLDRDLEKLLSRMGQNTGPSKS